MGEITPQAANERLGGCNPPLLLDIREEWELMLASLSAAVHIPMGQIHDRLGELDREREIVVMCHHGRRSRQVVAFLKQNGFSNVFNLTGGIVAWARDVDPDIPDY